MADEPTQKLTPENVASAHLSAQFRKRKASWLLFVSVCAFGILVLRDGDIGPNTAGILTWIIVSWGAAFLACIGGDAVKAAAILMQLKAGDGPGRGGGS